MYNGVMNYEIKHYSIEGLERVVKELGIPRFRADQILSWLYVKGVTSYDEMTNLSVSMRTQLSEAFPLWNPEVVDKQVSVDGSVKYLLEYHDGAVAETVALPASDGRLSVCVSSQAGCAMQCSFCATGKSGLTRSLEPGEIVDQLLIVQKDFDDRITNVVMMGQGEPFANYDNAISALRIMNNKKMLNIGARHITVSTCGLIKGIERFSHEPEQFTLAVSLHSAVQETRDLLMPRVSSQPLSQLRKSLDEYSRISGRRFTFEYALMKGINDSDEAFRALSSYCKGLLCHVNLIPLNKIEDSPYKPVPNHVLQDWKEKLEKAGTPASVRASRGSDIAGACGQLAAKRE